MKWWLSHQFPVNVWQRVSPSEPVRLVANRKRFQVEAMQQLLAGSNQQKGRNLKSSTTRRRERVQRSHSVDCLSFYLRDTVLMFGAAGSRGKKISLTSGTPEQNQPATWSCLYWSLSFRDCLIASCFVSIQKHTKMLHFEDEIKKFYVSAGTDVATSIKISLNVFFWGFKEFFSCHFFTKVCF